MKVLFKEVTLNREPEAVVEQNSPKLCGCGFMLNFTTKERT